MGSSLRPVAMTALSAFWRSNRPALRPRGHRGIRGAANPVGRRRAPRARLPATPAPAAQLLASPADYHPAGVADSEAVLPV